LSYVRYGYDGTLLAIYGFDRGNLTIPSHKDATPFAPLFVDPKAILENEKLTDEKWYIDMFVLIAFFLIFRIAAFFVLLWRIKIRR